MKKKKKKNKRHFLHQLSEKIKSIWNRRSVVGGV